MSNLVYFKSLKMSYSAFSLFYFSHCVVSMFGHITIYKSQSPLQMEIFRLKKIPFQELQRTARLDYKDVFLYL